MADSDAEKRYREALDKLLEGTGATRACLYLLAPTGEFRAAAHYGFSPREPPASTLDKAHPLFERINRFRKPFYVNSFLEAGDLREEMEKSRTARLLVNPLYENGRLIGILEARDKANGSLFFPEDVRAITTVGVQVLALHHARGGAAEAPASPPELGGFIKSFDGDSTAAPDKRPSAPFDVVVRPVIEPPVASPARPPLTQREAVLFRGFASAFLLSPAVGAVAFSLWTERAAEFYVGARGPVAEEARLAIFSGVRAVFEKLSPGRLPPERRFNVECLVPTPGPELTVSGIASAQSSAVIVEEGRILFFTLVLASPAPEALQNLIRETHLLVRRAVTEAGEAVLYRDAYRGLVRRLLEPGSRKYPQLVTHSLAVGKFSRDFAAWLKLPETQVEQITVAAILHDVGLRELSYDRLSEKRPLSEPEYLLVRDHPSMSAMLLSEVSFPYPVVPIVLHHHERYDGSGYPEQLRGDQIPFGARLLAIADAFEAMTAGSYRPAMSREEALETIVAKGGTQFDPELSARFRDFIAVTAAAPQ